LASTFCPNAFWAQRSATQPHKASNTDHLCRGFLLTACLPVLCLSKDSQEEQTGTASGGAPCRGVVHLKSHRLKNSAFFPGAVTSANS